MRKILWSHTVSVVVVSVWSLLGLRWPARKKACLLTRVELTMPSLLSHFQVLDKASSCIPWIHDSPSLWELLTRCWVHTHRIVLNERCTHTSHSKDTTRSPRHTHLRNDVGHSSEVSNLAADDRRLLLECMLSDDTTRRYPFGKSF